MHHFSHDLRDAWRGLRRSPIITIVALVSIALAIGANTAIFTLVDQVLLRQLPVTRPGELVLFTQHGVFYGAHWGENSSSYPMYEDYREAFVDHTRSPDLPRVSLPYDLGSRPPLFAGVFCRYPISLSVGFDGNTDRVPAELISGTYFSVLGVGPAIGRVIGPEDDRVKDGHPVAVLSYDYWRSRFAADRSIVGRTLTINNIAFTIIGVSQAGFDGLDIGFVPSVRIPMMMRNKTGPLDWLIDRRTIFVQVYGRLLPGVTREQALTALRPFFHAVREQETHEPAFRNASPYTREQFLKGTLDLEPAAEGRSLLRDQLREPLWLLMGIVVGVLLIACANVGSLLIGRAASRHKEIAVRRALGASPTRIVCQLLVESLLLSTLGGVLALIVAAATNRFLLAFMPTSDTPHGISVALDRRILTFNFVLTLLSGILFGLMPALRASRSAVASVLKDDANTVLGGRGVRLRKGLIIVQVMLSVVLLIGAGLFTRSLRNLYRLDLGLNPDHVITFSVSPNQRGYTTVRSKQFLTELVTRLRRQPGVTDAGLARVGLLVGDSLVVPLTIEGHVAKPDEDQDSLFNAVGPGFFKALGTALISGRDFDDRDATWTEVPVVSGQPAPYKVVIVNETFVKQYFGDTNPLGRHIGIGRDPGTTMPMEIVGVVRDAQYAGVRDDITREIYFPFMQANLVRDASIYVRTSLDPATIFASARQAVRDLDAGVAIYEMRTLEQQIDRSLVNERLMATLAMTFSIVATTLAMIGLYGVMAYMVARRRREIGIRMALGAAAGDVLWLVMREVLLLAVAGVAFGIAAAWLLGRVVANQLYGIVPHDPVTIATAALLLIVTALLAGYIPARRATRVGPVQALRDG